MWQEYYLGLLFIINLAKLPEASEKCSEPIRSTYGHYLSGHVIVTRVSSSISGCSIMCSYEFRCKSMNFLIQDKSCDLNDADRHTHPEDYGPMEGSVYMDTTERHRKVRTIQIDRYHNQQWLKIFWFENLLVCNFVELK